MDPWDIVQVIWHDDGRITALDANGAVMTRLTPEGLADIREMGVDFRLTDDRKPDKTTSLPKAHYDKPVVAVATVPLNRKDLPLVIDGVSLETGDRILLTAQPKPFNNGVHMVKLVRSYRDRLKSSLVPIEAIGTCVVVKSGEHAGDVWSLAAMGIWILRRK